MCESNFVVKNISSVITIYPMMFVWVVIHMFYFVFWASSEREKDLLKLGQLGRISTALLTAFFVVAICVPLLIYIIESVEQSSSSELTFFGCYFFFGCTFFFYLLSCTLTVPTLKLVKRIPIYFHKSSTSEVEQVQPQSDNHGIDEISKNPKNMETPATTRKKQTDAIM